MRSGLAVNPDRANPITLLASTSKQAYAAGSVLPHGVTQRTSARRRFMHRRSAQTLHTDTAHVQFFLDADAPL